MSAEIDAEDPYLANLTLDPIPAHLLLLDPTPDRTLDPCLNPITQEDLKGKYYI